MRSQPGKSKIKASFGVRILALGVILGSLAGGCHFGEMVETRNISPVILGFTVNNERVTETSIREGDQTSIGVVLYDPNGDELAAEDVVWTCTDGTPLGDGVSILWEPPSGIDWVVPPQDVPVTCTACVTDNRSDPICADLLIHVVPPCPPANEPPDIVSITAAPETIVAGDTVALTAVVTDPEGDPLSYEWTATIGRIEGDGANVDWVDGETCCPDFYVIELEVSDGCKVSWDYIEVWVDV